MAGANQNVESEETGWVEISEDVIDWLDVIAQCYDMTTRELAEKFLRHGAVNYERILDDC